MPGLVPGIYVLGRAEIKMWMAGTSPAMTAVGMRSPRDLGKIRDRARGGANFVQKLEAIFAQRLVLNIDGDLVEESIDTRAELRHRAHGGLEVFRRDRALGFGFGDTDRLRQRFLLSLLIERQIGRARIVALILSLFDADDVGRALVAGEEIFSVLSVEEFAERFDATDDEQKIVLAF